LVDREVLVVYADAVAVRIGIAEEAAPVMTLISAYCLRGVRKIVL
jgi:hypothetical protein